MIWWKYMKSINMTTISIPKYYRVSMTNWLAGKYLPKHRRGTTGVIVFSVSQLEVLWEYSQLLCFSTIKTEIIGLSISELIPIYQI